MTSSAIPVAPKPIAVAPLNKIEGFLCGGLAGCAAVRVSEPTRTKIQLTFGQVTVSNPAEMAKTRLQLDAELNRGNKVYSGPADVFRRTWKSEGIRGIQRGLAPAVRR